MEPNGETKDEVKEQRSRLHELVHRAKRDPNLMQRLRDDPVTVLQEAGVSDGLAGDFLREEGFDKLEGRDATLTPGQQRAVHIAMPRICWFTCAFTSNCQLTINF